MNNFVGIAIRIIDLMMIIVNITFEIIDAIIHIVETMNEIVGATMLICKMNSFLFQKMGIKKAFSDRKQICSVTLKTQIGQHIFMGAI